MAIDILQEIETQQRECRGGFRAAQAVGGGTGLAAEDTFSKPSKSLPWLW